MCEPSPFKLKEVDSEGVEDEREQARNGILRTEPPGPEA